MLEDSDIVCFDEKVFSEILNDLFIVDSMLSDASKNVMEALDIVSREFLFDIDDNRSLSVINDIKKNVSNLINNINYGLNSYRDVDESSFLELEMFDNNF